MSEQIEIHLMHLGFLEMYTDSVTALENGEFEEWDILVSKLLKGILIRSPEIKTDCSRTALSSKLQKFKESIVIMFNKAIRLDLLDYTFECKVSIDELQKFMACIVISLNNLVRMKTDVCDDLKTGIESLKVKINSFSQLFDFGRKWRPSRKPIEALMIHIQNWAYRAACLSILYWSEDGKEESIAAKLNVVLSDLLQKIKSRTPDVIDMYLDVLRTSRASPSDIEQTTGVVVDFVDFLLESMDLPIKDGIQTLRDGLITLLIFRTEKSSQSEQQDELKSNLIKFDALLDDAVSLIRSLCVEPKESILEARSGFFHEFIKRIEEVKANIIELYSSSLNYPTTNLMGFIVLLLDNLEKMLKCKPISIAYIKHQFEILLKELQSLRPILEGVQQLQCKYDEVKELHTQRPFVEEVQQLQNEHDEVTELWMRTANMAYRAENVVKSFCCMRYYSSIMMLCLSDVTEEIMLIKNEVLKTRDQWIKLIKFLDTQDLRTSKSPSQNVEMSSTALVQSSTSRIDEVVGFEAEAEAITNQLKYGPEGLRIVSIVGMPGQGKTTLAEKIYKDPSVKRHFHRRAWICVSQSYQIEQLLIGIINDLTGNSHDVSKMGREDLEDLICKSLKGQKYLIILDDIWDVEAWNELKNTFPDDQIGSRIMFTSRNRDIALQTNAKSFSPVSLCLLSKRESWKLLQQKLDGCPQNFSKIGMQVVEKCKGLPLAIVVIAGLLAGRVESLEWWEQIAENLGSFVAREGCMDVVELSYKHLPEYLKPCFLYLGVFDEDQEIKVQKLIRLWISEGFVQHSGEETLENVAKKYLNDLTTRSLVTLSCKSSAGGIKACRIHDVLRKFCLVKGERENFFRVTSQNGVSDGPGDSMYKNYRLCIRTNWSSFLNSNPAGPYVHSLMVYQNQRYAFHDLKYFRFNKFERLEVLDMERIKIPVYQIVLLASLFLLRYLAIYCKFGDSQLPSSIVQFVNLETISLKADKPFELPERIWTSLKKLRHVNMSPCFFDKSMSSRYVNPGLSSHLENLQTFSTLSISSSDRTEDLFGRMPRVRKLKFRIGQNVQFPILHILSKLESLNVEYIGHRGVYEGAVNFPSTLKKLTLTSFSLPWSEMSLIGNLPNLEVLKLLNNAFKGETWEMKDEGFSNLKFLKLNRLDLAQWSAERVPFRRLEQLVVEFCDDLEEIPDMFGKIATLKTINVCGCRTTVNDSAMQIRDEQVDFGNVHFEVNVIQL